MNSYLKTVSQLIKKCMKLTFRDNSSFACASPLSFNLYIQVLKRLAYQKMGNKFKWFVNQDFVWSYN